MIGCAVLAAGSSQRLGRPKQLVLFEGVPLVRHAAEAACASSCDHIAVIVGAEEEAVAAAFAGLDVAVVGNPAWGEGMGASVRAAAAWARAQDLDALVLVVCDQPLLTAKHIDALVAAYRNGAELAASVYSGARGVPALFSASTFDRLVALGGERGAGAILRGAPNVVEVPWPEGAFDVDTEADVSRLHFGSDRARSFRALPK